MQMLKNSKPIINNFFSSFYLYRHLCSLSQLPEAVNCQGVHRAEIVETTLVISRFRFLRVGSCISEMRVIILPGTQTLSLTTRWYTTITGLALMPPKVKTPQAKCTLEQQKCILVQKSKTIS